MIAEEAPILGADPSTWAPTQELTAEEAPILGADPSTWAPTQELTVEQEAGPQFILPEATIVIDPETGEQIIV